MEQERYQRISDHFLRARHVSQEERQRLLAQLTAADRSEVESLLSYDREDCTEGADGAGFCAPLERVRAHWR